MAKFFIAIIATALFLLAPTAQAATGGETSGFSALNAVVIPKPEAIPEASKADAAYNIGVKYYNGSNGYIEEAVKWFRNAADLGSTKAQYRLGAAYERGEGTKKDYKEALKWYGLAAKQDDKNAQCGLGGLYANGNGVKRDPAEAAKWYKLSAPRDVDRAQYGLGLLYLAGHGVKQDYYEAYFWLALAARTIDIAMEKRDEAATHLNDEQLKSARQRLKDWKPAPE
ncbi:MAG: tetratricopeptide repeat protein [Alphaproteobacteria bacterium]